ncbi:MAG: sugar transferase [Microgenomates group bacterium]
MLYRVLERVCAGILLIFFLPLLCVLYIVVRLTSRGPFLFTQLRIGKNKKPFWIYKIRTMVVGAEGLQARYKNKNEADGPVFKMRNDPRYTRVGKFLSHSALDELPQLINIVRGEMAFVGPRPLPKKEALRIPKKYHVRFTVLPGMTSTWIVNGAHSLTFKQWMELDSEYVRHNSLYHNSIILLQTGLVVLRMIVTRLLYK